MVKLTIRGDKKMALKSYKTIDKATRKDLKLTQKAYVKEFMYELRYIRKKKLMKR